MKTLNLITQLLPSRAPDTYQDPLFSRFGRIDKADIALALAGLPKVSYFLICWQLLQDKAVWPELVDNATAHMLRLAKRKRWKLKNKQATIKRFVITALLERSGVFQCQTCGGSGIVDAVSTCDLCGGSGKLKFTQNKKEKMCGVKQGHWKRDADHVYRVMLFELEVLENEAFNLIGVRLHTKGD